MGRSYSTRCGSLVTRHETDPLLSLDVRWLRKLEGLRPHALTRPQCTARGVYTATIRTVMSADGQTITLTYRTGRLGKPWNAVEEVISLDATPCTSGVIAGGSAVRAVAACGRCCTQCGGGSSAGPV